MEHLLELNRQHLQNFTENVKECVAVNITRLIQARKDDQDDNKNQNKIKDQCAHIERCDGLVTEDIREWIRNVNLAVKNTEGIPHNVRRISRKTTTGALYRAIERWCLAQENDAQITWDNVRKYVQDSFLGANEDERLRLELSKIKQGADGILMYNRKFRELADAAYGEQRQDEAERTVRRHYLTSLNDRDLAKKAILECDATTLEGLITYVDKIAMGMELYNTMFEGEEPMDCSVVGKEKGATAKPEKSDVEKRLERQNTKIAKLQAQVESMSVRGPLPSRPGKRIVCFQCGREEHMQRECRNRPIQRPGWRVPSSSRPQAQGLGQGNPRPGPRQGPLPPVGHGRSQPLN